MPARTGHTVFVPGKGRQKSETRPKVSRKSGGTSGDLTVKEHKTKTPVTVYVPNSSPPSKPKKSKAKAAKSKRPGALIVLPPAYKPKNNPHVTAAAARTGAAPPPEILKKYAPRAYEKQQLDYLKRHENLGEPEDITHAIEAATIVTGAAGLAKAGVEAGAKALGSAAAKEAGERALEKGVSTVEKKAGAKIVAKVKAAPKQAAERAKRYPGKKARQVKAAPRTAKKAVATSEGRRATARGAGRTVVKHPVKAGVPAAAALPPGAVEVNGFDPGQRARAFLEGTAAATVNHPGQVAVTTGHGVLGFLTAPLAVGGAAVKSARTGSTDPLTKEASTLYEGTKQMATNLASGDPKKVEQTTLHETGLVPFIPVPHLVRKAKGTSLYEDSVRGKIRATVETRRAGTREKRIAKEAAAKEAGRFVPKRRLKGKIRQPVADSSRPGENYVFRGVGKLTEKQRSRHHTARTVARMQEEAEYAGKREAKAIAKPLRRSKGVDRSQQNDSDALAVILKHGLPLDQRSVDYAHRLLRGYGDAKPESIPAGVHLDRHSAQWIVDHPEMFQGKRGEALSGSAAAFERQSEAVGTSARHRYLAQVHNLINPIRKEEGKLPVLFPEERVGSDTAALLKKAVPKRTDRWSRKEALDYAESLKQVEGAGKTRALKMREALLKSMDGLMRPPEHGGAEGGVSTTRAVAWNPEQEKAFVQEVLPEIERLGLRKPAAYVANKVPSGLKGEDKAPNYGASLPLRKVWPSRGLAAQSGNAESGFESLLHHSVEAPRARDATVRGLERIFDRSTRKVEGKRFLTQGQVEQAINAHKVPDGTIFVRPQMLKALLKGENHMSPEEFQRQLMAEVEHGQKLSAGEELAGEVEAMQGAKGEKFAPMDGAAIHELMGHMEPLGRVTKFFAHSTNFATRTILNSPAFALIQVPQEGLPLAAALGRNVVHIPRAIANLREIAKLDAEDQAQIKAVVGSSVGVLGAPSIKALRSEGYMNPIRAAGGKSVWRHAWEVVNGSKLGQLDRSRAGLFREVAGMAKVEGDFRRASKGFNFWRHAASNMFANMDRAIEEMKGMTPAERMAYVAAHPKLGDQFMKDMNAMAGNWNSFTVFEKHFAPLTIFYPFQRYSVLWMLYHFPMDHPVVATALATLGQVNAQELQKIAATKGAVPGVLDYTMPVVQSGEGKEPTILPAGVRTFPGLSTVQQSLVTGKPSQLIGEVQPPLAIAAEAALGKSGYTGQDIGENGLAYAARQFANLSPLARFLGLPKLGESASPAAQAFAAQDPLRTERSVGNPLIGQTAEQYANTKKLEKEFDTKYGEGDIPGPFDSKLVQELLYGKSGRPRPELLPKVLHEIHKAESASGYVKRKEAPFLPAERPFTEQQKELLRAVEDAWKTGPNGEPTKKGQYGSGGGQYSSGKGQYSSGPGQYSAGVGQYGGG
jgi:hypothetical protein